MEDISNIEHKLKATVIVWGNDNYNVLGLLRQLTPFVQEVIFLANRKAKGCASKSRYCHQVQIALTQEDAMAFMLDKGTKICGKGFIITTSDLLAEYVDQHSKELSRYYVLSTTKEQGRLTEVLNKDLQCKIAKRVGFNVPESRIFQWNSNINDVYYPCIVKPAFKLTDLRHPFKTCICKNLNELKSAQQLLEKSGTYVLQQYIEKEYDLLIYGCRLEDGSVIYAGVFTKYRWAKNGDGSYGFLNAIIPQHLDVRIKAFLEEIGYCGLFSAEFGVENGDEWFYEFNLRNDGTSHYFYQAGLLNIPLMWIKSHNERNIDCGHQKFTKSIFLDEINDKDNISLGAISKPDWKRQRNEATVFKYYDNSDKLPFYYMRVIKLLSDIKHKIG